MRVGKDAGSIREPAVAGSFYPADPVSLRELVEELIASLGQPAERATEPAEPATGTEPPTGIGTPLGLLVPHAGLVYSGRVAAAAWLRIAADPPATLVLLGTNHVAGWLDGVGVWDSGAWETPLGPVTVDDGLARAVLELGRPFLIDRAAHRGEHSLEVQLPFVRAVARDARIVPLAVAAGTGWTAQAAGDQLGRLLAERRAAGERIALVISTDAAHYPEDRIARAVNERLSPALAAVDAAELAARERDIVDERVEDLACGMCGIQPAVLGLAALRAMGATRGTVVAAATSADAGGGSLRTVGYLGAAFD